MKERHEGDLHNFGKSVQLIERASGWYQKPRPVFWEAIFLGHESPLRSCFDFKLSGPRKVSDYLFNLTIERASSWSGASKAIKDTGSVPTQEHFYAFGVLLGYTYFFGIKDLHKHNLVLTPTHLQAVDIEVVLTGLIIPSETVLLPFKDVPFEFCGLSRLVTSLDALKSDQAEAMLRGFVDVLSLAVENLPAIQAHLFKFPQNEPIRMILRNTGQYRCHLDKSQLIEDLLPEEKIQLDRGDVPYFFKFLNDENLYWISEEDFQYCAVGNASSFKKDVARHGIWPAFLIPDQDKIKTLLVHGLLFLQKKLGFNNELSFQFAGRQLVLSPGTITLSNPHEEFVSLANLKKDSESPA